MLDLPTSNYSYRKSSAGFKRNNQHKWHWKYVCLKSTTWPLDAAARNLKSHDSLRVGLNHSHLIGTLKGRCSRPVLPLIQGRGLWKYVKMFRLNRIPSGIWPPSLGGIISFNLSIWEMNKTQLVGKFGLVNSFYHLLRAHMFPLSNGVRFSYHSGSLQSVPVPCKMFWKSYFLSNVSDSQLVSIKDLQKIGSV